MKYIYLYLVAVALLPFTVHSQQLNDSLLPPSAQIPEVEIISYPSGQSLLTTPASVAILDSQYFKFRVQPNLVSVFNMVPGVRMEERSPGSYRFSIRGSLLRSPFGVRNVKIYLDEYPLTDGGGNTYLNCIDLTDNSRAEIIKGPDGSLFGANTGGVVHLISSGIREVSDKEIKISTGSYGLFTEQAQGSFQVGKHLLSATESYFRSDGYRDNSAMHKLNFNLSDKWDYNNRGHLKLLLLYSDLYYQTPGGLTLEQEKADPGSARPATATLPSAAEQQAAIYTKMLFAGATNDIALSSHLKQVTNIFGSAVDFKNPFITNYETRKEYTLGARTCFEWHDIKPFESAFHYTLQLGGEWTQTNADIHNYDNNKGEKGDLQASDDITSRQFFVFSRIRAVLYQRWTVEAAISRNYAGYHFNETPSITDNFQPEWMPRIAVSYKCNEAVVLRASVSKGYSTPTTAEIRPSNNQLYLDLQPEHGWNYEAGVRIRSLHNRLIAELTAYHYRLQDAIVRHLDNNGAEFFTNAGGTRQTGLEGSLSYQLITAPSPQQWLQGLSAFDNVTWNAFYFNNYKMGDEDYSGNKLTGVPAMINILGVRCDFMKGFSLSASYNYTGKLPLNDANDTYASPYNLLQAMIAKKFITGKSSFQLSLAVDNLLNETYSLGNDINAAAGRYYNPAAKRNWIASVKLAL